jgi:hypothetical protein
MKNTRSSGESYQLSGAKFLPDYTASRQDGDSSRGTVVIILNLATILMITKSDIIGGMTRWNIPVRIWNQAQVGYLLLTATSAA